MVVLAVVLVALDERIQDAGGPGILGFEFAGDQDRAEEIRAEWGDRGSDAARLSLWLDYPYLAVYGAFWAFAVAAIRDAAGNRRWRRFALWGGSLAAFPIAAAAFDAVEDAGLLLMLGGHGGDIAPPLAAACAAAKFALIGVAILYTLAGLARLALIRLRAG